VFVFTVFPVLSCSLFLRTVQSKSTRPSVLSVVKFLCLQYNAYVLFFFIHYCVLLYDFRIKFKLNLKKKIKTAPCSLEQIELFLKNVRG